jgi:hypothetical protein
MPIQKGTWVEIEQVILTPEQRAPSVPEDTRQTPLKMFVAGFLTADAELGQTVAIRTLIGRELSGTLKTVNPSYNHSFGETVPELLNIGAEVQR